MSAFDAVNGFSAALHKVNTPPTSRVRRSIVLTQSCTTVGASTKKFCGTLERSNAFPALTLPHNVGAPQRAAEPWHEKSNIMGRLLLVLALSSITAAAADPRPHARAYSHPAFWHGSCLSVRAELHAKC
jgi:hypothetical protein